MICEREYTVDLGGDTYSIVLVKALVLEGVLGDLVGEGSSGHQANAEERGNLHLES